MSFQVDQRIWEDFPGMRLVVAYGKDLDNSLDRPELKECLRMVSERMKSEWTYPNAQSHPYVAAWRQSLKRVGISPGNFPCAIESLCRQAISGREIHNINALVDFYNMTSLQHISPVGGWDVSGGRNIALRRTTGGEPFTELGKSETVIVKPNEISYAENGEILTRHFVWRQSERGKVTHQTTEFFLVSEVLPELGLEVASGIQRAFIDGLQRFFGIPVKTAILDSGENRWSFGIDASAIREEVHHGAE